MKESRKLPERDLKSDLEAIFTRLPLIFCRFFVIPMSDPDKIAQSDTHFNFTPRFKINAKIVSSC